MVSDNFVVFHSSAMEEKRRSGILSGRPFGGTAILIRKHFAHKVSIIKTMNPRITAVCIHNTGKPDMVVCSVYMPYNDRSVFQIGEYESAVGSLQAIIDSHLDSHLGCSFVIGGDWNLDKSGVYPAEPIIRQLCSINNLCWLDPCNKCVDFTYHSDVNGHFSLIDHFMCSNCLISETQIVDILADGNNTSDHYAISVNINTPDHGHVDATCRQPQCKYRWDRANLPQYQSLCSGMLDQLRLPTEALLCLNNNCTVHNADLEMYYCNIVDCLQSAASHCVPKVKVRIEKYWWPGELEELKQECIDITSSWRQHGCPRSGEINDKRARIKLEYKYAIKEAITSADEDFDENLADHLCKKDFQSFWKTWRKRFCSKNQKPTCRLNNQSGDENILDEFSSHFSKVSECNTKGADDRHKTLVSDYLESHVSREESVDCSPVTFSTMQEIIESLKPRKCAGQDGITNEHIMFGVPYLVVHLCLLFTAMLKHSFVPSSFQFGVIVPIPKDKHGDLSNLDMYRGITLTPAISRLFESILLAKYGNILHSHCLQYGFKKDSSCTHALFNFTESVRFYNKRGSKVYCAFLDASKAFDKVLISGLIAKLIKRQAPLAFIRILVSWYGSLQCSVVWNSLVSAPFKVNCGVRQGGVLSPFMFDVNYVDDLRVELRQSCVGLYIGSTFTGALLYADDIALLACSWSSEAN